MKKSFLNVRQLNKELDFLESELSDIKTIEAKLKGRTGRPSTTPKKKKRKK
jgi:hypothetical protein